MKRITRIIIDIVVIFALLCLFFGLAYGQYKREGIMYIMQKDTEILCYVLCGFCYLGAFNMISKKIKRIWGKWVFALAPSTLFTAQVMLFNSFLRCLNWNFGWYFYKYHELLPYKRFIIADLSYKNGIGAFRYPLCFVIMFALCGAAIFIQSERGQRIKERLVRGVLWLFDFKN